MVAIKSLSLPAIALLSFSNVVGASPTPGTASLELAKRCEILDLGGIVDSVTDILGLVVNYLIDDIKADTTLVGDVVADLETVLGVLNVTCLVDDVSGLITQVEGFLNELL